MSLKRQLRSVIEWNDTDPDILFFKWTEDGGEIKNASKLIVGPGQGCVFVYEGLVKDVLIESGLVDLSTENVPFWTTVKSFIQGAQSEHKVGIYFFRHAEMLNIRWGTPTAIKYQDPKYNFPVGLGSFGNYSMRITKPKEFFSNVVAGANHYGVYDIQQIILSRISQVITDFLAKSQFSYAEVDAHRLEIAQTVQQQVKPIFSDLGFQLTDFRIEGTNFDEATQERIAKIADMSAEAQAAAAAGIDYVQLQQLNAMKDAAKNENSTAAIGMALNTGMGFGQMMGQISNSSQAQPNTSEDEITQKLSKLKKLFDNGLIDEAEYSAKKKELLSQM